MSPMLRRNLTIACTMLFFVSLVVGSASAQNTLSLQAGDNVIISGSGTKGTYSGNPINNAVSSYSSNNTFSTIEDVENSTVVLQSEGTITNNGPADGIGGDGLVAGGNVIISGGSITANGEASYGLLGTSSYNYITVSGGDIYGNSCALAANGPVTITGGTFSTIDNVEFGVMALGSSNIAISGGNFPSEVAAEEDGTVIITGGAFSGGVGAGAGYGGAVDLVGSSFVYTPDMYSPGGGVSVAIISGFIPAGHGTITGRLYDGEILNTLYVSGGSIAEGTIEVNAPLPVPPTSPAWGAKVTVMLKGSPIPIMDRLVSFDGDNIVFAKDLEIDPAPEIDPNYSVVSTMNSFPISDIASITLTNPTEEPNKYIVQGADPTKGTLANPKLGSSSTTRTVSLQPVAYNIQPRASDGSWNYAINSIGLGDDGVIQNEDMSDVVLNAIPRVYGPNDPVTRDSNTSIDKSTENTLTSTAAMLGIPPQIMYGIAWQESAGDPGRYNGVGWNQFGFYTIKNSVDHYVYRDDPAGQEETVLTYDGGIGMMQITGGTAINGYEDDVLLTHLYNLAADTAYNINAGAKVLYANQHQAQKFDSYLEDWFFPVGLYNGAGPAAIDYRNRVWSFIKDPPYLTEDVQPVAVTTPPAEEPPTSFPAHADVNFDGKVDLILQQPRPNFNRQDQVLTFTAVSAPQNSSTIVSDDIYITDSKGNIASGDVSITFPSPQSSSVTIGGVMPSTSQKGWQSGKYTAHIFVVLSTGAASEATYGFSI